MIKNREESVASRFKCSKRERALFEAGIKMGTIYHQFVGTPVDTDSVERLEDVIERSIMVQPYVKDVKIRIDRNMFGPKIDEYSYVSLTGEMLDVILTISIDEEEVTAEMRYDPALGYPLMYVSR